MEISDESIFYLSKTNLSSAEYKTILYLMTILNNNYFVCVSQSEIAREISLLRQQINLAMKKLTEKEILIKGKPVGRQQTYKINKKLLKIERKEHN